MKCISTSRAFNFLKGIVRIAVKHWIHEIMVLNGNEYVAADEPYLNYSF